MVNLAIVGPGLAITCTGLSIAGIIFLLVLGALFKAEVEGLTESTTDPDDPQAVAWACFMAAGIYAGLFLCCGCQVVANRRQRRNEIRI